jgi:AraC family transcriptional regulator, regulatory protein of adaptative response / methylated-DNA-[protein]-cysteine methyltransferase
MDSDYTRVADAIRFLDDHVREQPSLERVASAVHLSPFHFQRIFRRWAGITPKRFLEYLTVEYSKRLLDESASVLDTALDVGLSSPARLHDHFVALEAMSPGEYKAGAAGLVIRYGIHASPFGAALVAITDRGICGLSFLDGQSSTAAVHALREAWPDATIVEDPRATENLAKQIFAPDGAPRDPIPLFVRGTNFQVSVWKALLAVPFGRVCSYERIARAIGNPKAVRAVGTALAKNPIAFLIPCHRVIRASGVLGEYRWKPQRKRAIIAWEAARSRYRAAALASSGRRRAREPMRTA